MADLPLGHQLSHRRDRVFNRNIRVQPVREVDVDRVHTEPAKAGLDRLAKERHRVVDSSAVRIGDLAHQPELRGDHHAVAVGEDKRAQQLFVVAVTVAVGGVEQGYAELQCPVKRAPAFGRVAGAVELTHSHAAESLHADQRAGGPERGGRQRRVLVRHCTIQSAAIGAPRALRDSRPLDNSARGIPASQHAKPNSARSKIRAGVECKAGETADDPESLRDGAIQETHRDRVWRRLDHRPLECTNVI